MDWHDIRDPNDPELERLAARYQLHPLHVEDCRHRGQNAKLEEGDGYLFVVLKPVLMKSGGALDVSDLDVFLGRDFVITVDESGVCCAGPLLDRVRTNWRGLRADQVLHRVLDSVVDAYVPVLDSFSEEIDELEDKVLEAPSPETLSEMFSTKRGMIEMRRVAGNMRDVASDLQRSDNELIGRDLYPFLRDVHDHLERNLDLLETQRDLLNGTLDIYLSIAANRTNQVMKVLTVLGTITLPAVIITSLFGMNVEGIPWKGSPYGFWVVSALSAAVTALTLIVLRRFGWW